MSEQLETEKMLSVFQEEIRGHKERYADEDATLALIDIEKLSVQEMEIWDKFKNLLKMVDSGIVSDEKRLVALLEATGTVDILNRAYLSADKNKVLLGWIANKLNAIYSVAGSRDLDIMLPFVLGYKKQFLS